MSLVVQAENISKLYQLGEISTGTISRDIERWIARMRGKEDPFIRIGEVNNRAERGTSDVVWALKDISFDIHEGDTVGIIGRNGAGKSTLLKLLSRVTAPTTGRIRGKGRIASLLEVGTGFNPELTGRDNIYLNGAILGMRKAEIRRHFDRIVDFAGIERYIDTPVKRYSSGMYVRLAFAVAAHLEAEILVVDEVLAVGDAEFQKKCLGKMGDISTTEGRTVLFVSHNMASMLDLCKHCMLLENGRVKEFGESMSVISRYIKTAGVDHFSTDLRPGMIVQLLGAAIRNEHADDLVYITLRIHSTERRLLAFDLRLRDNLNGVVGMASVGTLDSRQMPMIPVGESTVQLSLSTKHLALGHYALSIDLAEPYIQYFDRAEDCLQFEVIRSSGGPGITFVAQDWNFGSTQLDAQLIDLKSEHS